MTGRFIAVVGPSGVGKDSFMAAMAATTPRISLVRRVITRASDSGGEDFHSVSVAVFKDKKEAGDFALWWPAHGLYYGIPKDVDTALAQGKDVMANLSRGVLVQAEARFENMRVIALSADRQVLRQRLLDRGREDAAEVSRRLERAGYALPHEISAMHLDNSGPLAETVRRALNLLYPEEAIENVR